MTHPATLYVVDDDASSRDAVCALAREMGLQAVVYESADAFLRQCRDEPGCVVADLKVSGGAALQDELRRRGAALPIVFLANRPSTGLVVQAMRAGAVTVVEKPWTNGQVEMAVREGLELNAQWRTQRREQDNFQTRLASLTDKEREVLRMLVAGNANKTMASLLGASLRTVENRRRSIFAKLGAHSVAELVAAVLKADGDSRK